MEYVVGRAHGADLHLRGDHGRCGVALELSRAVVSGRNPADRGVALSPEAVVAEAVDEAGAALTGAG